MATIMFTVLVVMVVLGNGLEVAVAANPCRRRCGSIDVPYPFGIRGDDPSCYYSADYLFLCNVSSVPGKLFRGDFEIVGVNISPAKVRALMDISYDCYNASGRSDYGGWRTLLRAPYTYSYLDNVAVALGCDIYAQVSSQSGDNCTVGCVSICDSLDNVVEGYCSGLGCCQMSIPKGLNMLNFSLGSYYNHSRILDFNPCGYLFLVQKNNYTFRSSDLKGIPKTRLFPIVWDWYISENSCQEAIKNKSSYACISSNSHCLNSINGPGYVCNCSEGYEGNPYVHEGCKDINECEDPKRYPCNGTCTNKPGSYSCTCPLGTTGDPKTYGCTPILSPSKRIPDAIVIPVVVLVFLFSLSIGIWIYSMIQKRRFLEQKDKYFRKNGGIILKTQMSSRVDMQKSFKIFSIEEIEKATNKFDQSQVIGHGGQGVVFKGKLPDDDRVFAIKKSILLDGSNVEGFINELVILSQINHRNVVRLVGCCLDKEDPLLVYEFIPNGPLFNHIHKGCLPWNVRLKIAYETADALAHLHFKVNNPIIHRDVKSSNILIDIDYTAKISDFGASRLVPADELQVTTLVQGTMGYLDPEYLQSHQLTDKSDVYSFGVVLVEIITGKLPFSSQRSESEKSLAITFISYMKNNKVEELLDERVLNESTIGQMKDVAKLALQCLCLRGEERPSMIEVARQLEEMRRTSHHPWIFSSNEDQQILLGESPSIVQESSAYFTEDQTANLLDIENGR